MSTAFRVANSLSRCLTGAGNRTIRWLVMCKHIRIIIYQLKILFSMLVVLRLEMNTNKVTEATTDIKQAKY